MNIHAAHSAPHRRSLQIRRQIRSAARFVLLTCLFAVVLPALAQSPPPALAPADIATRIAGMHPKTVVFVFDVTMSTEHNGVFQTERAATASLLRDGCDP